MPCLCLCRGVKAAALPLPFPRYQEFVRHAKKLTEWGVKSTDFKAEFAKMDTNHGGKVLFDEFCHWAIPQNLDVEDDDDR